MDYKFGEKITGTIWMVGVISIVLCIDINAGLYMTLSAFMMALAGELRKKSAFKEAFITNLISMVLLVLAVGLVVTAKMI